MTAEGLYLDRRDAGETLASHLRKLHWASQPLVFGLLGGGVTVAAIVAEILNAPLEVFIVNKLRLPNFPETTIGAIASGGVKLLDTKLIFEAELTETEVRNVVKRGTHELQQQERLYQAENSPEKVKAQTVVVVDDGLTKGFICTRQSPRCEGKERPALLQQCPWGPGQVARNSLVKSICWCVRCGRSLFAR